MKEIMIFVKSHKSRFHTWLPLNLSVCDTQGKNDWGLLKHRGSRIRNFNSRNLRLMLTILDACCLCLFPAISAQFNVLRSLKRTTH